VAVDARLPFDAHFGRREPGEDAERERERVAMPQPAIASEQIRSDPSEDGKSDGQPGELRWN
jgi:hypothetical protein